MRTLKPVFRRLRRSPAFASIAVLTLAIGIGSNTAIFSVVSSVLIKPLPYPAPESLVAVWHVAPGIPSIRGNVNVSPTMYFTYREQNRAFEHFGVWSNGGATITGLTEPEQVQALFFTHGVLDALDVRPALGRWFSEEETLAGAEGTVILTHGFWQRRLDGDASAIGRSLTVDGRPRTIIGVMPRDFRFLNSGAELILPHQFDRNAIFLGNFSYQGLARLKSGVTLEAANADVGRMLPIWLKSWPVPPGFDRALFENARLAPRLQPLKQDVVGNIGQVLWVLMGTIGVVLLIACANVANLFLVRAEGRRQELAIRAALGAGWTRIAREMLLESALLGVAGGALGLALAYAGLRTLVAMGPATLPRLAEIRVDVNALAFTLAVSLLAGLMIALIPVVKYAGPRIAAMLGGGGRTQSHSAERHRSRNVLVVSQVSLALLLLVGCGLMLRTFQALRSVAPGFTGQEQIQMVRIFIPDAQVEDPELVLRMQQNILESFAALPGVTSASFANSAPLEGFNPNDVLFAQEKEYAPGEIPPIRRFRFIAPGYFSTTGTPVIAGRDLEWTDLYGFRNTVLVSENLARELWGNPTAAIGRRVRQGMNDPWREIIGVVGDVRDNGVQEEAPTMVYWPSLIPQMWGDERRVQRSVTFLIRSTRSGTEPFLNEVRESVWSVNPNLPVFLVRTLEDVYNSSMARTSFTLTMLGIASGMAFLLGVIGIYGVISYAVAQRTREIGIRLALGAGHWDVRRMFVRYGLVLAGIGVSIGLAAAIGLTRLMRSLLFEIHPIDPATYAVVSLILMTAATTASYLPARHTSSVDPVVALKSEQ